MTLKQGHIAKGKVTVYTWQFFRDHEPFIGPLDGVIPHTIVVHYTRGVVAGVFVPLGHV